MRLYHEGKERRFGSFKNKTEARDFYEMAKLEQKQGRCFPESYQHGGKELASAVIANYVTTLPTSGKKPTTIDEEQYYGRWWTDRLTRTGMEQEGDGVQVVESIGRGERI